MALKYGRVHFFDQIVISLNAPEDDWLLVAKQSTPTVTGYVPLEYVRKLRDLFPDGTIPSLPSEKVTFTPLA